MSSASIIDTIIVDLAWSHKELLCAMRTTNSILWARWMGTAGSAQHTEYILFSMTPPFPTNSIVWDRVRLHEVDPTSDVTKTCRVYIAGDDPQWYSRHIYVECAKSITVYWIIHDGYYSINVIKYDKDLGIHLYMTIFIDGDIASTDNIDDWSMFDAAAIAVMGCRADVFLTFTIGESVTSFRRSQTWTVRDDVHWPVIEHNLDQVLVSMFTSRMNLDDCLPSYKRLQ